MRGCRFFVGLGRFFIFVILNPKRSCEFRQILAAFANRNYCCEDKSNSTTRSISFS